MQAASTRGLVLGFHGRLCQTGSRCARAGSSLRASREARSSEATPALRWLRHPRVNAHFWRALHVHPEVFRSRRGFRPGRAGVRPSRPAAGSRSEEAVSLVVQTFEYPYNDAPGVGSCPPPRPTRIPVQSGRPLFDNQARCRVWAHAPRGPSESRFAKPEQGVRRRCDLEARTRNQWDEDARHCTCTHHSKMPTRSRDRSPRFTRGIALRAPAYQAPLG
jgi:hypothetical protein